MSGFDGSAGTAVVCTDTAALWTDGRYFLQAEQQLGPGWTLMRHGTPGCPEVHEWRCRRCAVLPLLALFPGELAAGPAVVAHACPPSCPTEPQVHEWLADNLPAGARVGIDPW